MIEGTVRIDTGHMTEAEGGIVIIVEDLGGEMRVEIEIEMDLTLGTKGRGEGVINTESQDILWGNVRAGKGIKLNKEGKTQMYQIGDVAQRS